MINKNFQHNTTIAKNLTLLVDASPKLRTEICKEIGLSYPSFSDILYGRSNPHYDTLKKIADYFDVTITDLILSKDSETPPVKIPLLGSLDETDILGHIYTSYEVANNGNFFAIKFTNDSMEPVICNNDIVTIKKTQEVNTGDIIAILLAGDLSCKKLEKNRNGINLVPCNSKYVPLYINNETLNTNSVSIIGKVIEIRRILK